MKTVLKENNKKLIFLLLLLGVTIIFAGDLLLPLGMAVGFAYIFILLISSRYLDSRKTVMLAGLSSVFVLIDIFLTGEPITSYVLFNRLLASSILWVVTFILVRAKTFEDKLRDSEIHYRTIVEATYEGILISDNKGNIKFANKRILGLLGYNEDQIKQKHLSEVFLTGDLAETAFNKEIAEQEISVFKKDGTLVLAAVTFIRLSSGPDFLVVIRDITARKKTEEALKESQARLSGIVSSAMDAIITINKDQNIILFNKAAEKLFGYQQNEILGKHIGILIPPDKRNVHKEYVRTFGETGTTNRHMGALGAVRGIKKNGHIFPIEASISQVKSSGEKLYTVILRDITEKELARQELNASLKEKEVLLKEVHHRVKNNLQIISSLLSLQVETSRNDNLADLMLESQNRIKSMALIHEKLYQTQSLSKINASVYLTELIDNIASSYLPDRSQIDIQLNIADIELDIDTGIDFGLIINELISNSLKYAFPGNHKDEKKIIVELQKDGSAGNIRLVIKDTGVGMNVDFKLEESDSLGLQLVNSLVEQLGGTVKFYNNKGTTVEIIIG
jgi:PAS domain S-box-containing protein